MSRPLVCSVLALAASISAASASEMSAPQAPQRQDPAAPTTTAAPGKAQPDIAQWMGHAVDDILSGKLPDEGRSSVDSK